MGGVGRDGGVRAGGGLGGLLEVLVVGAVHRLAVPVRRALRRDAEAEVTRLRVLLSGQAARLTTLSGDNRRQQLRQQLSKDLNDNLSGLEHDLSRLKVERDVTLAEVEELSAKR